MIMKVGPPSRYAGLYEELWEDRELFDISDHTKEGPMSKFQSNENTKVVGYEVCGELITAFVGLRPKMYSYIKDNGEGDKKAKGVKKSVVKKVRTHDYLRILENEEVQYNDMNAIRSDRHEIGSYTIHKVSLSY